MLKKEHSVLIAMFFISLVVGPLHAGVIYSNNFDNENNACWNDIKDYWRNRCGDFYEIGGGARMQLSNAVSRSGSHSAVWRAKGNEDRGQAYVRLNGYGSLEKGYDELYVQIWNYYTGEDGTFDHAKMSKHMRITSSNYKIKGIDIVVTPNDNNDDRDSESLAIRYNGPPDLPDWKAAYTGSYKIPDNTWVCYELHVKLNTPGKSDGLVELFINGEKKASKYNINIRNNTNRKMNSVLVGGWYSNGGKSSDQYNLRYMDDLVISTEYIGLGYSGSSSNQSTQSAIPPAPKGIRVESTMQ